MLTVGFSYGGDIFFFFLVFHPEKRKQEKMR